MPPIPFEPGHEQSPGGSGGDRRSPAARRIAAGGSGRDTLRVADDPGDLAGVAAATIAEEIRRAVERFGRCTFILAGGETPRGCYRRLASDHRSSVPWNQVHLFFGDERMVAPDDPSSNLQLVREELLHSLHPAPSQVHPVRVGLGDPEHAADAYHDEIRRFFAADRRRHPRFDLALLGLGEDGHTASLFPGCPALEETTRLAAPSRSPSPPHDRVTLTPPVFNAAAMVVFLVSGERKAEILRRVLEGDRSDVLPATRVAPDAGELLWLVDRDAAARLPADRAGTNP